MHNLILYIQLIRQYKSDAFLPGSNLLARIKIAYIVQDVMNKYQYEIADRATLTKIVNEIVVDRLHIDYAIETIEEARLIERVLDMIKPYVISGIWKQ